MAVLAVLAVICLLVLALPRALEEWRLYRAMFRLPGPPGLPLVGNLFDVLSSNPFQSIHKLCLQYQTVLRLWVSPNLKLVTLIEPADIKTVLGSPVLVDKPSLYDVFKEPIGPGLAFHPRREWKPIRAAVERSLHKSILATFVPTFWKYAAQFAAEFEELADEDSVLDITPRCGRWAHHAIVDTVLCSDNSLVSKEARNTYIQLALEANEIVARRIWRPWLHSDWLYSLTKDWKMYNHCIEFSKNFVHRVVSSKRETVAREKREGREPLKGRKSFLDHVLTSDMPFDGDLEVESRLLMLSGSESSMETLSFMYYALAIRQDLQAAIFKELDEVFGGDALRPVEADDLPHLEATERFIKEVLRMFPPLPAIARKVPVDVELPSGYTLPRGCVAGFFLPAVHRDPRWWERPDEFDPDRFLPENSRGRHPFAYLPFSAGPRNCVGLRYAMMNLKTHVATVLRRVQLLPPPGAPSRVEDIPVTMHVTTSVSGGARLKARRRPQVRSDAATRG